MMNKTDKQAIFWTLGIVGLALIVGKTFDIGSVSQMTPEDSSDHWINAQANVANDIDDAGAAFTTGWETFSSKPYWDFKGYSIGYGHFMGPTITIPSISEPDAMTLFRQSDAPKYVNAVNALGVSLNQNQFNALFDLAYREGTGVFTGTHIGDYLRAGDFTSAANEFDKWVYVHVNGVAQVNQNAVRRAAAEKSLFLS